MNGVLNFLGRVAADVVNQAAGAAADETLERIPNTGNAAVIKLHKAICEGDEQKEAQELPNVEAGTALGRCERLLDAEPDEHDRGEREDHAQAERVDGRRDCCSEVVAAVLDEDEEVHRSSLRVQ